MHDFQNVNIFVNDDWKNILPEIPEHSVDLVLSDPLYGISKVKWDVKPQLNELWEAYTRVLKPDGVVILFGIEPFSSEVRMSNLKWYRHDWKWVKPNSSCPFHAKRRPMRVVEDVMVFSPSGKYIYNPQMRPGKPYKWDSKRSGGSVGGMDTLKDKKIDNGGLRFPTQILEYKREITGHPTGKPTALLKEMILTYTNSNAVVLDNFAGSCGMAIACNQTNRKFI